MTVTADWTKCLYMNWLPGCLRDTFCLRVLMVHMFFLICISVYIRISMTRCEMNLIISNRATYRTDLVGFVFSLILLGMRKFKISVFLFASVSFWEETVTYCLFKSFYFVCRAFCERESEILKPKLLLSSRILPNLKFNLDSRLKSAHN